MAGSVQKTTGGDHFHHGPDQTDLERVLKQGATRVEPYFNLILVIMLAAAVISVGAIIWLRNEQAARAVAWTEFSESRAPEDYIALADRRPNTPVGSWSRLQAARMFLAEGLNQALTNRSASDDALNKAKSAFEKLLSESQSGELREEALYGIATSLEALSDGDPKPALDAYEQLVKEFPNSPHRAWVDERVRALKTKTATEFYAWLRQQDPKPADRPLPRDGGAAASGLPNLPVFNLDLEETITTGDAASESAEQPASTEGGAPALPADAAPSSSNPDEAAAPVPADAEPAAESTESEPAAEAETAPASADTESADETPAAEQPAAP